MSDHRERAKSLIRDYTAQIDILKKQFRKGELSKEDFMKRRTVYSERINGIQAVFK